MTPRPAGAGARPWRRIVEAAARRWEQLPGNARGALWILSASLAFSAMAVALKVIGRTMSVWEVLVLRTAFALLFVLPVAVRAGPVILRTRRPGLHLVRSLFGMGGLVCFFFAVRHLDLALATTLGFTRVLFMLVLAVLLLGETVRWRRTLATLVGFLGVVVCVRPGATDFDPWTLAALGSALFAAGVTTSVKRLTSTESPLTIVLYTYLVMGTIALIPAALVWRTPNLEELAVIAAMGLFSAWGQSSMVRGLRVGEATAIAPFEYSRLLYAALLGFLIFGEIPDLEMWLGAVLIAGSTLYIAVREARLGQTKREGGDSR